MTLDSLPPPPVAAPVTAPAAPRLRWAPNPSSHHVDGRWWPRSDVLTDELPGLLTALTGRVGEVATVIVVGADGRSVTLTVVPPSTPPTPSTPADIRLVLSAATTAAPTPEVRRGAREPSWADLSRRLSRASGVPEADVARWTAEAAAQFTGAPVQAFVPVLVEHMVRNRITTAGR